MRLEALGVLPVRTSFNPTHERCAHPMLLRNHMRSASIGPDGTGNFASQFRPRVLLRMHARPLMSPPLRSHIRAVRGRASEPKMIRVDAPRVVASMANEHPARDRSLISLVRNPMRSEPLVPEEKVSVTIGPEMAAPVPASVALGEILLEIAFGVGAVRLRKRPPTFRAANPTGILPARPRMERCAACFADQRDFDVSV